MRKQVWSRVWIPILVALIGLTGTVVVALINRGASSTDRTASPTPGPRDPSLHNHSGNESKIKRPQTLSDAIVKGASFKGKWRYKEGSDSGLAVLTITARAGNKVEGIRYITVGKKVVEKPVSGELANDQLTIRVAEKDAIPVVWSLDGRKLVADTIGGSDGRKKEVSAELDFPESSDN